MKEFIFENARVRIHPGKLSEEERDAVLMDATKELFREIQNQERRKEKSNGKGVSHRSRS